MTLLQDLKNAISNGEYIYAERVAEKIKENYEVNSEENRRYSQALLVRNFVESTQEHKSAAHDYIEQSSTIEIHRSILLHHVALFLASSGEEYSEVLLNQIDSLNKRERNFKENSESLRQVFDSLLLPPSVGISAINIETRPMPKGSSVKLILSFENFGGRVANTVNVSVVSPQNVTVTPTSAQFNEIAADSEINKEFTVINTSSGVVTIRFDLNSDNAGSTSNEIELLTMNKREFVVLSLENINQTSTMASSFSIPTGIKKSLNVKLDSAERKCQKALEFVNQNKQKQANQMLSVAVKNLAEVINQINQLKDKQISQRDAETLLDQTIYTKSTVELSIKSEI